MKKFIAIVLCIIALTLSFVFETVATDSDIIDPIVIDFMLTSDFDTSAVDEDNVSRANSLITSYALSLASNGNTLSIIGRTYCVPDVVKCGYKNLVIQRRKSSSDSWKEYYDYGNVYVDAASAALSTTLVVEAGYQYRVTCKHYAKKNLLSTQTISNTSNIVTVS